MSSRFRVGCTIFGAVLSSSPFLLMIEFYMHLWMQAQSVFTDNYVSSFLSVIWEPKIPQVISFWPWHLCTEFIRFSNSLKLLSTAANQAPKFCVILCSETMLLNCSTTCPHSGQLTIFTFESFIITGCWHEFRWFENKQLHYFFYLIFVFVAIIRMYVYVTI